MPPDRDYAIELGVETLIDGDWGAATLRAFHDVSGTHGGYELSAYYSWRWITGRLSFAPTVGVAYKSARLNDYYWGVHADEANLALPEYHPGDGFNFEGGVRGELLSHAAICASRCRSTTSAWRTMSPRARWPRKTTCWPISPVSPGRSEPMPRVRRLLIASLSRWRCLPAAGADVPAARLIVKPLLCVTDRDADGLLDDLRYPLEERDRRRVLPERQRR